MLKFITIIEVPLLMLEVWAWRGWEIDLGQGHKIVTTAGAGDRGQLGLVHEMGHFVFGILDEYLDKSGAKTADAFCVADNTGTSCIMDGGTTVAANK